MVWKIEMTCYKVLKDKLSTALWHTVRLSQFHLLVKYFVGKKQVMSAIETLMDNGNVMMTFFKNVSLIIGRFGQMDQMNRVTSLEQCS